jgi:hypothetical protein
MKSIHLASTVFNSIFLGLAVLVAAYEVLEEHVLRPTPSPSKGKKKLDKKVDIASRDSFPASDAPSH